MTFSIVGRCRRTGELGVAGTTAWFAYGALVPAVRPGLGAVASQALVDPGLRAVCLDLLASGASPEAVVPQALANDPLAAQRQLAVLDASGRGTAFTGPSCIDAHGHYIETDAVIAGNLLASDDVLREVAASWGATSNSELRLAERMLLALEAGQAVGGDKRGRQSAAMIVGNEKPMLQIDLRVDDHPDPLVELRRLLTLFRDKYEPMYKGLAPLGN